MTDLKIPSPECVAASRWIRDHLNELSLQYPNQWIAVCNSRVIGADADMEKAAAVAEMAALPENTAYHFVDDGTLIF